MKNFLTICLVAGVLISTPKLTTDKITYPDSVKDPLSLTVWLRRNFKYKRDIPGGYWQTPEETLTLKTGDCEDFAFLTSYILEDLGYETRVIWIYKKLRKDEKKNGKHYSHAICVFKSEDGYRYFSNQWLHNRPRKTFLHIINYERPYWDWYCDIELPDKKYGFVYRKRR